MKAIAKTPAATVSVGRIEWSAREIAAQVGISYATMCRPKYWRRYGGKKRGGRIVFSEATRVAIMEGKK